jgi:hypothetical protein
MMVGCLFHSRLVVARDQSAFLFNVRQVAVRLNQANNLIENKRTGDVGSDFEAA